MTDRAIKQVPNAIHISVENFLNSPRYDELLENLKKKKTNHSLKRNKLEGMAMFLSTREKEIIEMLIKYHGQYVTIYDIAQHLAVSSRTIHRELKSIEPFLESFNIELERVTKKVYSYLVVHQRYIH